ncbi:MAG: caspase family protein [Deltaproteobacteria bacterium]|nr:caspase family protein [Deltaproteobacteria bacterium]
MIPLTSIAVASLLLAQVEGAIPQPPLPEARAITPGAAMEGPHRFALFVGDKDGGPGTRPLHHAERDARRMFDIFTRLGGTKPEDARLLTDASADELREALRAMNARVTQAKDNGEATQLIVYFSGHSKDGALRLKSSKLPMDELRQSLLDAPADVRIGLFDSCKSGQITRAKGVRAAPAFDVQRARESGGARGLVLIASSAADEESQEYDDIDASFFTHSLASGLLGDADANGDGKVTLAEAYAYAYGRTVGSTAGSAAGAQHPVFLYDLGGAGDVMLTSLMPSPGGLLFTAQQEGVYVVLDGSRRAIAEVAKPSGEVRRLALAAGRYIVKKRDGDQLLVREVKVSDWPVEVPDNTMDRRPLSDDPQKGGTPARWSGTLTGSGQYFFDSGARNGLFPPAFLVGIDLQSRGDLGHELGWGLDVAVGGSDSNLALDGGPSYRVRFNEFAGGASIWRDFDVGNFSFGLGGRVAFLWLSRTFPSDPELPRQSFFTMTPGIIGFTRWRATQRVSVVLRGRLNYLFYNVDQNQSLGYADVALGVEVGFGD